MNVNTIESLTHVRIDSAQAEEAYVAEMDALVGRDPAGHAAAAWREMADALAYRTEVAAPGAKDFARLHRNAGFPPVYSPEDQQCVNLRAVQSLRHLAEMIEAGELDVMAHEGMRPTVIMPPKDGERHCRCAPSAFLHWAFTLRNTSPYTSPAPKES